MNIKKYYLRQFFQGFMPIYPIYMILFQSKNLTLPEISLLLAIWSLPVVVLEIPTGILSDRWSRKNMIILGGVLQAACFFTWIFSNGFALYAIGFVFWGISSAFLSGSEEALLFDSLKNTGKEDGFDFCLGRGRFLSGISTMIASILGGLIGMHLGFQYALYFSVLSGMIATVIACTYKEINHYKNRLKQKSENDGDSNTLSEALLFLIKNKKIFIFTLLAVLVVGVAGVLDEYDQLIAKGFGLTTDTIGIWTAIRFALIAFGAYFTHKIRIVSERLLRRRDQLYTLGFLCIISAAFLLLTGLIKGVEALGCIGLFYMIMSAGDVLQEDYIQQQIDNEGRSTVHSMISLVYNLYGIVCYGLMAVLLQITDLMGALLWVAAYMVVLTLALSILYRRVRQKAK
ncbi:MAG TPA: MFS transporter [Mobilitalea sp.]|nr:MFS transporter [Mobilitalea sp.]